MPAKIMPAGLGCGPHQSCDDVSTSHCCGTDSSARRKGTGAQPDGVLVTGVLVTDGHLPYPYGHEMTGYEVVNLVDTLQLIKKKLYKLRSRNHGA